jgi:seryl-tRNA(Sec) selenium transferase
MMAVAGYPVNLEYNLSAGKRGRREETIQRLLVD